MAKQLTAIIATAALGVFLAPLSFAAEKIGVFETILESSESFEVTTAALEGAIEGSEFKLHATHDVRVPDDLHKARVYVLTSPAYTEAAAAASPRTISAQVLRVAVYTWGEEQATYVNMANPVAQAMVFYAGADDEDALLTASRTAAEGLRALVADLSGKPVSIQTKPLRSEKHYNKYKGDGPARMMAKFRNWYKSQLEIDTAPASEFDAVVDRVTKALAGSTVADAGETEGWETIATIRLRDDAVYIGLTNPYIEDKMVRINSRFRGDNKTDAAPYPGVDHVTALPTEVLIVKDGDETLVLHYGQMWRMQLYFWDSGYRAFTANMGVPGAIANSIEDTIKP